MKYKPMSIPTSVLIARVVFLSERGHTWHRHTHSHRRHWSPCSRIGYCRRS